MTLVWLADPRLTAEVSGPLDAPPINLIHGLGPDLYLWDGLMPSLPRARVLLRDQRGPGHFDTPPAPCAGGDDRRVPPALQRKTADLIAGADYRVLPTAPHPSMLTTPSSFGEALGDFLTRISHVWS